MALNEDVVRLAKGANFAVLVTLMPSGQPQAQIRWIDTDGDKLIVNTEPQRQAARNVARDPRVTVLLWATDDIYDWAEVRGRVVSTAGGDEARAHIDAVSRKYTGNDYQPPVGPQGRLMLFIEPVKQIRPRRR